jgi:hypothetical protein
MIKDSTYIEDKNNDEYIIDTNKLIKDYKVDKFGVVIQVTYENIEK